MSETPRCEPADPTRDGWHWVHTPHDTTLCCFWAGRVQAWTNILGSGNARHAHHMGYRYLMPVPTPAEIAALVQRAADLERYVALNAMDRLVEEGPKIIGWEKTPDLMQKLEALRAALAAFPAKETPDGR